MVKVVFKHKIQEAIEQARATCLEKGNDSRECAARWDIVEELQAALFHRQELAKQPKTAFEQFCEDHPEAVECRIYDV